MSEKGKSLDSPETRILKILDNHKGKDNAIAGYKLADLIDICDRRLRQIVNHLIFEHLIPIASSTRRKESGYFLIQTDKERHEFYWAFRHRGLTSLTKAARVEKQSLLETSLQLTLDQYQDGKKVPGAGEALSKLLKLFSRNPRFYAREIEALKNDPVLFDKVQMEEIKTAAQEANTANQRLQRLTAGILS